ncbi:gly-9, partial [Symbiodinium pilosum]
FLMLGGYDQEMRLYGGEEMEISFRTWMCGGAIEHVPCSHVGHVFRTPKYWQGQVYEVPGEEIARNKLRAAEVWLDDYKKLMQYATMLLPKRLSLGDVSARKSLRQRLGCAGFE